MPASPSTLKRTGRSGRGERLLDHADERAARSRRTARRRPPRATGSRARGRSTGCGAPTPRSPPWPPATSSRRPCSRSSDEIVCRLFFTRWWISRIVASFDSSSRSRRRSSEMSRSSTTAPRHRAVLEQRDAAHEHRDLGPSLDLLGDRRGDGERGADRRPRRGRARRGAGRRRWRGRRCGAAPTRRWARRTRPGRCASRSDHAVADPGRLLGLDVLGGEREVAGGDHAGEAVEDVDVGALELARLAAERRASTPGSAPPMTSPLRSGPGCTSTRTRSFSGGERDLALDDLAEPVGPGHERALLVVDDRARPSRRGRRSGWWSAGPGRATTNRSPPLLAAGREEQEVGEAEVGEQAPRGHEALQVRDPRPVERRCAAGRARPARPWRATLRRAAARLVRRWRSISAFGDLVLRAAARAVHGT